MIELTEVIQAMQGSADLTEFNNKVNQGIESLGSLLSFYKTCNEELLIKLNNELCQMKK